VFINIQDWVIRRGIESHWKSVPWWLPPTFRSRFNEFYLSCDVFDISVSKRAVRTLKLMGAAAAVFIIIIGFYILTFKAL